MPAALQGVDWEAIKLFVVSTSNYIEAASQFGVKEFTIRQRSHRENWPVQSRVSSEVKKRQENDQIIGKLADSWLEKGEQHRARAFGIATKAMEAVERKPLPLKDWSDLEKADKMARRAAGLEDEGVKVAIGVQVGLTTGRMGSSVPAELDCYYSDGEDSVPSRA